MLVLVLVMLWTMLLFDRMSWAVPLLSFTTDTSTVIQYLFVLCPFKQSPFVPHPLNFRYHPSLHNTAPSQSLPRQKFSSAHRHPVHHHPAELLPPHFINYGPPHHPSERDPSQAHPPPM